MLIAGCAAIERLLRDGNYFDVNRPTTTTPTRLPMRFAIRNNRLDLVQLLIHHRADPNAHDEEGTTLQAAFDNPEPGSSEILRFLLACGAHPDAIQLPTAEETSLPATRLQCFPECRRADGRGD